MADTMTVRCACGWEVTGPETEVVDAVIDHGSRIHNMVATRDEVLATARASRDQVEPAAS